ncbi:MAG: DUF116 domain-containing protein [Pseudomonadota bacterium]
MHNHWRLLASETLAVTEHLALDRSLLERRRRGGANSLRIYRYATPAVALGVHQIMEQEVRWDYCQARRIAVARRMTGGGALYLDDRQLHWSLIAPRAALPQGDFQSGIAWAAQVAIDALKTLGVDAVFRPRNDIEVNGKKLGGINGVVVADTVLLQGSILFNVDVHSMLWALKVPMEKLTPEGLDAARDRVVGLVDLLSAAPDYSLVQAALAASFASALGVEFSPQALTPDEQSAWAAQCVADAHPDWVQRMRTPEGLRILQSVIKRHGGVVRANIAVDMQQSCVTGVTIAGDFDVQPSDAMQRLARQLSGVAFPFIKRSVETFFEQNEIDFCGLTAEDFMLVLRMALEKIEYTRMGLDLDDANAVYPVNVPEGRTLGEVVSEATVMLLPYCAKLPACKFRFTQGCSECGMCTIGDAYRLARERGMEAVTIIRFEHLQATLTRMKETGVKSYIGACCEEFFVKRQQAFLNAGIPGVLLDIDGKTCYQMREEDQAYAGTFTALADLKQGLVSKVLAQIPVKIEMTAENKCAS